MMHSDPTVLIVDDNPADVVLMREALKGVSCAIQVASNSQAALEMLASPIVAAPIRLIFADVNLPAVSGFEVAATVRKSPELRHIPVVLLSSSARPEEVQRAYDSGSCCLVQKPSDLDPFLRAIRLSYEFWCTVATLPPPAA
jgi:two-component system, chemotaxis family, response regulator Rcp1